MSTIQTLYPKLPESQISFNILGDTVDISLIFQTKQAYREALAILEAEEVPLPFLTFFEEDNIIQQTQPLTWFTLYYLVKEDCLVLTDYMKGTLKKEKRSQVQDFLDKMNIDFVIYRGELYVGSKAKEMRDYLFPLKIFDSLEELEQK